MSSVYKFNITLPVNMRLADDAFGFEGEPKDEIVKRILASIAYDINDGWTTAASITGITYEKVHVEDV